MSTKFRLLSLSAVAVTMLYGSSALAALSSNEQKCIDGYNNKLRLVSQQAGKSARACIKNAGKGKEPAPEACLLLNPDGKIAGKEAKVTDLYTSGKCNGAEPIQQGAPTGNSAHRGAIRDLTHMIFGDPVHSSTVISPGKDIAKCQDKAIQRAGQAFTEKVKGFRKCKKDGMKGGLIINSATLEALCMPIPDPAGKIAKKVAKLASDVLANCGPPVGPPYGAVFAGACAGSATTGDLAACIDQQVECKVCLALNEADGMSYNCDLFDDGLNNGSCGLSQHKCVLDVAPATDSQIQIHIAALPVPLSFGLSGSLDIGSGGTSATCDIQMLNPVNIPAIGFVCIDPSGGCPAGTRHCGPGPGPALGVDVQSDGNAGVCTGNAHCTAIGTAACAPNALLSSSCTGYCTTGAQMACTTDAQCGSAGQGACNGPNPVAPAQANICQTSCINTSAHGASLAGAFQCQLGSNLNVEMGPPCDGTDVLIAVGTTCIPVTTQRATALITDANFLGGTKVPNPPSINDQLGAAPPCVVVDSSTVTGLIGVGAVNFFGSALGDLSVAIKATCL